MACVTTKRGRLVLDFYDQHGKRRLKTLKEGTTKKEAKTIHLQLRGRRNKDEDHSTTTTRKKKHGRSSEQKKK